MAWPDIMSALSAQAAHMTITLLTFSKNTPALRVTNTENYIEAAPLGSTIEFSKILRILRICENSSSAPQSY